MISIEMEISILADSVFVPRISIVDIGKVDEVKLCRLSWSNRNNSAKVLCVSTLLVYTFLIVMLISIRDCGYGSRLSLPIGSNHCH